MRRTKETKEGRYAPAPPDWTEWVRVDTIVECWEISKETQGALLTTMPDAYGGEGPGEDDWPEPDAARDEPYKVARIWFALPEETRQELLRLRGAR